MALRILSGADIRKTIEMGDIIEAMATAFSGLANGEPVMPIRAHIDCKDPDGTALFMPSYMKRTGMFGVKTVTLFADNPEKGLPYIQGMVCLFDGKDGTAKAILDGQTVTSLRTGAVSGLATKLLARTDSRTAAIFGAGVQGRTQLEAVCAVRDIKTVYIFDPSGENARRFAAEMGELLGVEIIVAESSGQAVENADIICTASVSSTPVFNDRDLKPGVHINAVGSYKPHVQEVPEEMVLRAKLVVDHEESAMAETGDLIIPVEKGLFTTDHIYAELGDIVLGKKQGRTSNGEITFFKSVGVAIQDLTAGAKILEKAAETGTGVLVEL